MNQCFVVFLKVFIATSANTLPQGLGYDLGASCDYDEDCVAAHSFCRNQQVCQCRRGFTQGPDGITCIANIGALCKTKFDCITLSHSDCIQYVCECEPNFVPDPTGTQCLPRVAQINGKCQQDNQCQASFGEQSHCYSGRCECIMRHHYLKGHCYVTKDITEFCGNSRECYIGPDYTDVIECKDHRCQCIEGYLVDEYRKCKHMYSRSYIILLYIFHPLSTWLCLAKEGVHTFSQKIYNALLNFMCQCLVNLLPLGASGDMKYFSITLGFLVLVFYLVNFEFILK